MKRTRILAALAVAVLVVTGAPVKAIAAAAVIAGLAAVLFGQPGPGVLMIAGAAGAYLGSIGLHRSIWQLLGRTSAPALAILALAAILLTACGAGGGDDYAAQLRGNVAVPASAGLPTLPPPPTPTTEPTAAPTSTTAPPPTTAPAIVAPAEAEPTAAPAAQPLPTAEPVQSLAPQVVYVTATPAPLPGVIVVIAADTETGACRPTTAEPCEVQP